MSLPVTVQPGDVLLYRGGGFFSKLIALKTWHNISHVEIYAGGLQNAASRDGIGVGMYDVRENGLVAILRPTGDFDINAALDWFETVIGQKYDWLGLLRFAWFGRIPTGNNNKQFCSEFATRFLRAGGCDPFPREDADAVAPYQFKFSAELELIWEAGK